MAQRLHATKLLRGWPSPSEAHSRTPGPSPCVAEVPSNRGQQAGGPWQRSRGPLRRRFCAKGVPQSTKTSRRSEFIQGRAASSPAGSPRRRVAAGFAPVRLHARPPHGIVLTIACAHFGLHAFRLAETIPCPNCTFCSSCASTSRHPQHTTPRRWIGR